jgi:hypothetical protein
VGQFVAQIGSAICMEILNRPSVICAEPRNMIVFGWLVLIVLVVALLTLATFTWTDPNRR